MRANFAKNELHSSWHYMIWTQANGRNGNKVPVRTVLIELNLLQVG